ncbi:MAG: hypothetical protein CME20_23740 [Gemmatimonadetes bacterium]|nr:hypothetical protein [Gemmatimonadota bacterium]
MRTPILSLVVGLLLIGCSDKSPDVSAQLVGLWIIVQPPMPMGRLFMEFTADGRFIVYDYKTGREPRTADIARGLNLQLPLYLLAVESLLQDAGLVEGVGGGYLLLRDLEHCGRRGFLADETHRNTAYVAHGKQGLYEREDYRQLLEAVRGFVLTYARAMRSGIFHVTRHNPANTCPGCAYAQSCRLDPRRMRTLDRTNKLP